MTSVYAGERDIYKQLRRESAPGMPADLIFKVGKGQDQVEFKAHGFCMYVQSAYVREVMSGDGQGINARVINLPEDNPHLFTRVLEHCYEQPWTSEKLPNEPEIIERPYAIPDNFSVKAREDAARAIEAAEKVVEAAKTDLTAARHRVDLFHALIFRDNDSKDNDIDDHTITLPLFRGLRVRSASKHHKAAEKALCWAKRDLITAKHTLHILTFGPEHAWQSALHVYVEMYEFGEYFGMQGLKTQAKNRFRQDFLKLAAGKDRLDCVELLLSVKKHVEVLVSEEKDGLKEVYKELSAPYQEAMARLAALM